MRRTRHDEALESLRRLHADVPALFEDAPEAMALYDVQGRLVDRNRLATHLFGEVGEGRLRDVLGIGERAERDAFRRVAAGETLAFEAPARTANGETIAAELSMRPARQGGRVAGVYVTLRDRGAAGALDELTRHALQESRSLFEHSPDGVAEFGVDGRCIRVNDAYTAMTGWTTADLFGRHFSFWRSPEEAARGEKIVASMIETAAPFTFDATVRAKDGRLLDVEVRAIPKVVDGIVTGYYGAGRDVTETRRLRAAAAEHVRRIEALYRVATSNAGARDQVDAALATGLERLGYSYGFVARIADGELTVLNSVGESAEVAFRPVGFTAPISASLMRYATASQAIFAVDDLAAPPWDRQAPEQTRDWRSYLALRLDVGGRSYGALGFASTVPHAPLTRDDATFVRFIASLVGTALQREAHERRLGDLAMRDPLTGLPNRSALHEAITAALADEGPAGNIALLYVDLDRFKPVNDSFGHEAGDETLRAVAARLRSVVRVGDLIGRLGGDEFVVLQRAADRTRAISLGNRIVAAVREPYPLAAGVAHLGASVGVALAAPGEDADALLRRADAALYAVKSAGGDGVRTG